MAGCPALDRVRDGQAPAEVVHALKEIAQIGENDAPAPAFGAEAGEGGKSLKIGMAAKRKRAGWDAARAAVDTHRGANHNSAVREVK